ncbi:MAG: sulfatase, partial [Bacteroidota bacterium]
MTTRLYLFLLLGIGISCQPIPPPSSPNRPNILYIMTDDHAFQALGAYQQRLAAVNPTPVLDELAAGGRLFTQVVCNNSICTPSRASIMTGQYPQTNGVLDLDGRLPEEKQYLPQEMKRLGYQTAIIGKWHLKEPPEAFDYYQVLPIQGKYFDPILYGREGGDSTYLVNFSGGVKREISGTQYDGHSSDVITDLTLDWLQNQRQADQPFFLMHHYKAPHDDFEFAPRYADYLADTFIPEPSTLYHQPEFGSEAIHGRNDSLIHEIATSVSDRHRYRSYTAQYQIEHPNRDSATSLAYQEYLKRYLRCVKGVDDNLKRLFDYLKANGLWENTLIVYTSDQGMMLGEHDFMDKRWMYEEAMRMPFIMSWPGVIEAGSTSDLLINNTDFAPTLIEVAGGEVPDYMQGHSFAPSLSGEELAEWRTGTYYRYWMHLVHHDVPAHFGIRTHQYKLIFYYGDHYLPEKQGTNTMWWLPESFQIRPTPMAWEFYDLEKDPQETENRYDDPLHAPPSEIAEDGIPGIKAYFEREDFWAMKQLRREHMAAWECENAD